MFTVSIGLAEFKKAAPLLEDTLKQADRALYTARKIGWNQVVVDTL